MCWGQAGRDSTLTLQKNGSTQECSPYMNQQGRTKTIQKSAWSREKRHNIQKTEFELDLKNPQTSGPGR